MREMKNTNKKIQLDEQCMALDLELPAEEFSGKQHRNVVLETYQESDLELTLATGSSTRRKETSPASDCGSSFSSSSTQSGASKRNSNRSGLFQVPEIDMRFNHERHIGFKIEEQMRQDGVKQHTWSRKNDMSTEVHGPGIDRTGRASIDHVKIPTHEGLKRSPESVDGRWWNKRRKGRRRDEDRGARVVRRSRRLPSRSRDWRVGAQFFQNCWLLP
ncbi:hypothetical protein BHM03_00026783 [Ensete ventricosum]|nr:hypothetical protein BHM03_00026783 [Ensete ventricosum]